MYLYIYKKHDSLLYVMFLYRKKADTSKKSRQFTLRFFIYKNPDTFRYAIVHGIFEMFLGEGHL